MHHTLTPAGFLLAHFEKIILGGFAGWLALVGLGFASAPGALSGEAELSGAMQQIDGYMGNAAPGAAAVPRLQATLRENLDPLAVPAASTFEDWTLHRRPQFLYVVAPPEPDLDVVHRPSRVTEVDVERRGRAVVRWSSGERSRFLKLSFELQRREGEGAWERVASVKEDADYTDETVRPATSYSYRVISTATLDDADDMSPEIEAIPAKAKRVEGPASEAQRTPVNIGLSLNMASPGDPVHRVPGSAQLFVHVWNAAKERFDRKLFQVEPGKSIGTERFVTGAILERIWIEEREVKAAPGTKRKIGFVAVRWPGEAEPQVLEVGVRFAE